MSFIMILFKTYGIGRFKTYEIGQNKAICLLYSVVKNLKSPFLFYISAHTVACHCGRTHDWANDYCTFHTTFTTIV